METISKKELIKAIAEKTEVSQKDAGNVINATLEMIQAEVAAGNKVAFLKFGTFEPKERAERKGHNPQTGETIIIPARKVPVFKAGKGFKDMLN